MNLIIIRGLPGSGKSTLAQNFVRLGYEHYEADMYFERDGFYQFDATKLGEAHLWCRTNVYNALVLNKNVVVSNTFVNKKECKPYLDMVRDLGCFITIISVEGNHGSVHGVPDETLERMKSKWQNTVL